MPSDPSSGFRGCSGEQGEAHSAPFADGGFQICAKLRVPEPGSVCICKLACYKFRAERHIITLMPKETASRD